MDHDTAPAEQLAAGAVALGLVSLVTCWWFPFGPILGLVGCVAGALGWCGGRGPRARVGTLLAGCGAGAGLLLPWGYWRLLTGF